jgi:DNA ligase-1
VLLVDVATTSVDVGGSASRRAKIARIAELLGQAKSDPALVAIVVAWLSGDLPQRQIGVGWAALRSLPAAAARPSLTVLGVDTTLSTIGAVSGKGSQAQRAELVAGLFASATDVEQTFLRHLLTGELRQGALAGVMADAVAEAAQIPAATVRRAAMLGGALPAVASAGLTGGAASTKPWKSSAAQEFSRRSWTAPGCRYTERTIRSRSTPEASTTSPHDCPRWSKRRWRCRSAS